MGRLGTRAGNGKKPARRRALQAARSHPAVEELAIALKERNEALEHQAATAEILRAMSKSPGDAKPVFQTIVDRAHRLCGADYSVLYRYDGKLASIVADRHINSKAMELLRKMYPAALQPDKFADLAMLQGKVVHSPDIPNDPRFPGNRNRYSEMTKRRAAMAIPLLRGRTVLGAIACGRLEARAFSKREIALARTFADQAVIAIENARLFNETKEALEQQTASAGVLGVISGSPTTVQPVFDMITRSAVRLCEAVFCNVLRYDGEQLHVAAHHGFDPAFLERLHSMYPMKPDGRQISGRVIRDKAVIHIGDATVDAQYDRGYAAAGGWRRMLGVPMLREGRPLGVIVVAWKEAGTTSDKLVRLLQTFADQAAIAIENVRLFNETKEALEQQTATSKILGVISSSPTDLAPVFDAILKSSMQLCDAHLGLLNIREGDKLRTVAQRGGSPEFRRWVFERGAFTADGTAAQALAAGKPFNIADARDGPGYREGRPNTTKFVNLGGVRSFLAVPLMKDGTAIGNVGIYRPDVRPFSEKQVALVSMFANQAVIAIENTRLFNETKEALERQTATSEVLKTISRSTFDLNAVLQVLIENATRLAGASQGFIFRFDGEVARLAFSYNAAPAYRAIIEARPLAPGRGSLVGRVLLEHRPVHIPDALSDPEFTLHDAQRAGGFRSMLGVPMMREGNLIGVIAMWANEVRPFTEKQIELVSTFADQAVIAIENVRLFNETREALEKQTATAEILRVLSANPADTQPVFEAIVRHAAKLCDSVYANVFRYDGERLHLAASEGVPGDVLESLKGSYPMAPNRSRVVGRVILEKRVIGVENTADDPEYDRSFADVSHHRRILGVPLMRDADPVGAISIGWNEPGAILPRHEELLRTFADQAVIAIENVRLFNETKEALERQTATSEILKVIASSPSDVQPVFDAIAASARRLLAGGAALVARRAGDKLELVAYTSAGEAADAALRKLFPAPITGQGHLGKAILSAAPVGTSDIQNDETYSEAFREVQRTRGVRSIVSVPMLRDGEPIGVISVNRPVAGNFSDHQTNLLKTFADQAVIAIENVRLFNETKEALERQTATAEILKVISSSPTDVQPVFDAIVRSAARLFDPCDATITMLEHGFLRWYATAGLHYEPTDVARIKAVYPLPFDPERSPSSQAIQGTRIVEIMDAASPDTPEFTRKVGKAGGFRSACFVPLIRESAGIGTIILTHPKPGFRLSNKQLALVQTFADQAVIAIENVRLFKELQARTEALTKSVDQLTALGEVGQAISSTLDLETVLKTIVARAVQLTGLDGGSIYEYDERAEEYRLRAAENLSDEIVEVLRGSPIRSNEGPVWEAGLTGQPTQITEMRDEGYQTPRREFLLRAGYRALLVVPLMRENRIVGALSVQRKAPGAFAPEVVELLKTFATHSALAIQNARLFREIAEKGRQLEVASQHKSQFLASMSHELRTPLNALLGFNEMLLGDVYGEVPGDMRPPLAQMQSSGKHLLRLINNVLDLAKIESGRMELALAEYSVHDTVEGVRSTLQPLAAEKGLDFRAAVPPEIPLAYGDPGRITQCLMNLAGNSLKFTKAGKVEISVAVDNGLLRYRVADTGIGIPPDKIEGLFTEFKQTDATVASEYGGTGLGLSISKKFVEMHGGRIWAESEPGRGSVFTFEVPLRAKAP
jgi:GAF domain-containing protein